MYYLSDGRGQKVDDSLVWDGDNALAVYLDDAVSDSDAPALGNATAKKAADLKRMI